MNCHFVYDEIQAQRIFPAYIPTDAQAANIFTKALRQSQFRYLLRKLGVQNFTLPFVRVFGIFTHICLMYENHHNMEKIIL